MLTHPSTRLSRLAGTNSPLVGVLCPSGVHLTIRHLCAAPPVLALTACRCTLRKWLTLRRLRIMQLLVPSLTRLTVPWWCPGAPVRLVVSDCLARLCLASSVAPVVALTNLLTVREWTMLNEVTLALPMVCPNCVSAFRVVVAMAIRHFVLTSFLTLVVVPALLLWHLFGPLVVSRMRPGWSVLMLKSARPYMLRSEHVSEPTALLQLRKSVRLKSTGVLVLRLVVVIR